MAAWDDRVAFGDLCKDRVVWGDPSLVVRSDSGLVVRSDSGLVVRSDPHVVDCEDPAQPLCLNLLQSPGCLSGCWRERVERPE